MKHFKRVGILVGACVPFASMEQCQHDIASSIKEEENNIEIIIETVCQQECSGRALVVCATMDKEEEISAKLTNEHDENELGIKFVSFKWTYAKGIMNATRMDYCNKEDLRFEVLKVMSVNDAVEHEHELESAKEMLGNAEVNQIKVFVGIEQEAGKNEQNVLVVMHRDVMAQEKD